MNHFYRIIFNQALGVNQAVSEHAKTGTKTSTSDTVKKATLETPNRFRLRPLMLSLLVGLGSTFFTTTAALAGQTGTTPPPLIWPEYEHRWGNIFVNHPYDIGTFRLEDFHFTGQNGIGTFGYQWFGKPAYDLFAKAVEDYSISPDAFTSSQVNYLSALRKNELNYQRQVGNLPDIIVVEGKTIEFWNNPALNLEFDYRPRIAITGDKYADPSVISNTYAGGIHLGKNSTFRIRGNVVDADNYDFYKEVKGIAIEIGRANLFYVSGDTGASFEVVGHKSTYKPTPTPSSYYADTPSIIHIEGSFYLDKALIEDNEVINQGEKAKGAALRATEGAILDITDTTFNKNTLHLDNFGKAGGAAIYSAALHTSLDNVQFTNNKIASSPSPSSNGSIRGGAAYFGGVTRISNSIFSDNSISSTSTNSGAVGGAAYFNSYSLATITNTEFNKNKVVVNGSSNGGAIYTEAISIINNSSFYQNKVISNGSASGGAIYTSSSAPLSMNNVTFIENHAEGKYAQGGALDAKGLLFMNTVTFYRNTVHATDERYGYPIGGAMVSELSSYGDDRPTSQLLNVSFIENKVESSYTNNLNEAIGSTHGGALYNFSRMTDRNEINTVPEMSIVNSLFSGNSAIGGSSTSGLYRDFTAGGAIANDGILSITGTRFENNLVKSKTLAADAAGCIAPNCAPIRAVYGGAIYNSQVPPFSIYAPRPTLYITNSVFDGNKAESLVSTTDGIFEIAQGGAIYNKSTVFLTNTSFINNTVDASTMAHGAAIFHESGDMHLVTTIGNTLFSGNLANGQANSIHLGAGMSSVFTVLNVLTGENTTLDMRDPMTGHAGFIVPTPDFFSNIHVAKNGPGTWKLGGFNGVAVVNHLLDRNDFTINQGTLYLYRDGEVANANKLDANAKVKAGSIYLGGVFSIFNIGAGATLAAAGGNSIVTDGTLGISSDARISLNAAKAVDNGNTPSAGNAILQLGALTAVNPLATVGIVGTSKLQIDLMGFNANDGKYTLVHTGEHTPFNINNVNGKLTVLGQDTSANSRLSGLSLEINDNSLVLNQQSVKNGTAGWKSSGSNAVWDISGNNWSMTDVDGNATGESQYIAGDAVHFGNDSGMNQNITVHEGGASSVGMVVDSQHDYTFSGGEIHLDAESGSMAGSSLATGSLDKSGSGTLNLNSNLHGNLNANQGKVIVGQSSNNSGTVLDGDVSITSNAIFGGHGIITGHVALESGATLAPGNSIGKLTVGSITFNSGSKYEFEALPSGDADQLIVKGGTVINGGDVNVIAGDGNWALNTNYTLINAEGGLTGEFDNVTSNFAFLTPTLTYNLKDVKLSLTRNDVTMGSIGFTHNQRNVGYGVESLYAGHPVYDAVIALDIMTANQAYDNLSGEVHASTKSALLQNSRFTRTAINQRLSGQSFAALQTTPETQRGVWLSTWVHDGYLKGNGNAAKADNKGAGFLIGVDTSLEVGENTVVGIAAGYDQSKVEVNDLRNSNVEVDAYHFMGYAGTSVGPIDLRGGFGYSLLKADSTRNIWVNGLQGSNKADYNGSQAQIFLEGSHTFKLGEQVALTPYANVAYTRVKMDNFNETGTYSMLSSNGGSDSVTSTMLGARGQVRIGASNQHSLYADLGWQHNFGDRVSENRMNFIGGMPFSIKGTSMGEDNAIIGIGANFELKPNLNLGVSYEGIFGSQVRDHGAKLNLNWSF